MPQTGVSKAILASPWTGRHGPLLIAEIGGNHEGEFDSALRLLDLALDSGADYAKFQLLTGDGLVSAVESPDRHRHFQRFELSREQHLALARRCVQAGVGYLASVWDLSMLDWIDDFLSIYKVGSGDLTAYPLLRELARRGKPIILSTGLSTLEEVLDAIKFLQTENPVYCQADKLALMQCTSAYPTPDAQVNLRAMDTLRAATGMPVGYSDHTIGDLAVFVAAARGADLLEFHFTDEREGRSFRDHAVSLTRDDVRRLCQRLDCLRNLLGDGNKVPQPVEVETGHLVSFRRGIYSSRDLVPGERVRAEDLVCLRPNQGVDARQFDGLLGRKVVRSIAAFTAIDFASIGDGE
jgi:N-acetylneuraminate synthase/N,N'-diacetyllegionaminate synthase